MKLVCFFILALSLTSWHVAADGQAKPPEDIFKYKPLDSYVELSGGEFLMGINDRDGFNFEHPQRKGIVKAMRVMLYPVSLASFKRYKQQKYRHRTDAELAGKSWVFKQVLNENAVLVNDEIDYSNDSDAQESIRNEMVLVRDARWNRPEGGSSLINERLEYPVVHVSFSDASAYCTWKGMRLPNEIEWEYAARGGLNEKVYPWGDYWEIGRTNLWQGKFPDENQLRDNYFGLSPVNAFQAQNNYEMYDVIGNVWEWTTTL
jgi:sulfatase modifying factor 1